MLAVDLAEASVKVRTGPPSDDAEDIGAGGRWAGVLPVRTAFGPPEPCPTLPVGAPVPAHVAERVPRQRDYGTESHLAETMVPPPDRVT
ncbi:hypothetical protein BJF78_34415 [Pseudonocardia sp. CNS-139]|nr:hypothetical protein BJF78_34415 [Pseudonocardia sp. CNS-139]